MTAIFSQDTSYGGASDFDPVFSTSCSPPTSSTLSAYPTSSLRRQSSIALSAASKCMPLFQRAGSALAPRSKNAKVAVSELFSSPNHDEVVHESQDYPAARRPSIKMSSISETAAGWLGLSPTTTQAQYTTRTSSRNVHNTAEAINEEEEEHSNLTTSTHKSHSIYPEAGGFASPHFLATLPSSPVELTTLLQDLHKAYLAQAATVAKLQTRNEELQARMRSQEQNMHDLVAERAVTQNRQRANSTRGRATYMSTPPPLSPSLSMSLLGSPAMSSVFSSPVSEAHPIVRSRRERSPAMSDASSFPAEEEDDVFTTMMGSSLPGLSLWDENMMLKARVGELEEVVEGVLGLVGGDGL